MKRFLLILPVAASILSGCGAPSTQTPANQMRGLAASFVAGRAFDNTQLALKSADNAKLQNAGRQYGNALTDIDDKGQLIDGVATVVIAAMELERDAQYASLAQRDELLQRALAKYRAASAFLPANPKPGSVSADTLNMIGYSLADRGNTRADWERAAQLSKLSIEEWNKQIKALSPDKPHRLDLQSARMLGGSDSHAWALFRLNRIGEAVKKQEQVIEFARQHPAIIYSGQYKYGADIPYHMAEIYRAAGREDDARKQYNAALDLNPTPELFDRIEIALNAARA